MQVVDAHVHFWDPQSLRYGWLKTLPAIDRPFLPADLCAQTGPHQLEKIVFVQAAAHPGDALKEVAWVTALASAEPRICGIVADAPLERGPGVGTHLAELRRCPLVKGVRRLLQGEAPGFACQPAFLAGVRLLPVYDFSFDICVFHDQLADVLELVAACPEVAFVLDHFGKPAIRSGEMRPWSERIRALARFPNIHCKLSGLITEADHERWRLDDLRPYIDRVLECFGPARLMFGGDWPVSLLAADGWATWLENARAALAGLSETEQQAVFKHNATHFYRL